MNKWEYRRRVRHNKMSDDIDKRNRHRCAAAMAVCVLANIAFTICCAQPTASAYAQSADDVAHEVAQAACRTSMQWPLEHAQVIGEYDAPAKQWLPGHRGLICVHGRKTPSSRPRMVWSPSVAKWQANPW